MEKPTVFHALAFSFFSRDLYREVARNWRWQSFLYLLMLLAICWIPRVISGYVSLSTFAKEDAPKILRQIPRITITDGKVSTDADEPHYITDPDTGKVLAIIDTTGQVASLAGTDAEILVMQDRLIVRKSEHETRVYDLSTVESFSIDRDKAEAWLRTLVAWGPILVFPFLVLGSYVYRTVQALIYAVLGLLLNFIAGASLGYPAILRVAMVAVTPAVVLKTLLSVTGIDLPLAWLASFAVAMGYLYFGIRAGGPPADVEAKADRTDAQFEDGADAARWMNGGDGG